jgi:hypothetical protein
MFPSLFQHSTRKQRSVNDALHNENWIRDLMCDMTPNFLVQYVMLWILIDDALSFNNEDSAEDEII